MDVVSLFPPTSWLHLYLPAPGAILPDRTFTTGTSTTIAVLPNAAYVLLAKEFRVSVDKLVSSFGAYLVGCAISVYVALVWLVKGMEPDRIAGRLVQNPLAIKYGHRVVYLLFTLLVWELTCHGCAYCADGCP